METAAAADRGEGEGECADGGAYRAAVAEGYNVGGRDMGNTRCKEEGE